MEIINVKNTMLATFSEGMEKQYKGKSIVYVDHTKVFMYFYFNKYRKVYVIDNTEHNIEIPYIDELVRVVDSLEDRKCTLFHKYMKTLKNEFGAEIFQAKDIFYLKVCIIIRRKKSTYEDIKGLFEEQRM